MIYPHRIDLRLFDLSIDRIKEAVCAYVILNENHFIYHLECYLEKHPDKEEGEYQIKDSYLNYTGLYLKSAITSVELDFDSSNEDFEFWCVEINVFGMRSDIRIKCETQTEGQDMFEKIKNYILGI